MAPNLVRESVGGTGIILGERRCHGTSEWVRCVPQPLDALPKARQRLIAIFLMLGLQVPNTGTQSVLGVGASEAKGENARLVCLIAANRSACLGSFQAAQPYFCALVLAAGLLRGRDGHR